MSAYLRNKIVAVCCLSEYAAFVGGIRYFYDPPCLPSCLLRVRAFFKLEADLARSNIVDCICELWAVYIKACSGYVRLRHVV